MQRVYKIPADIHGMVWYQVKTSEERWHKDIVDLYYFEIKTSNKNGMHGITKNGTCKGPGCVQTKNAHSGQH